MSDRRRKLVWADRTCIQCGAVAARGKKTPDGYEMLSITPLLYIPGRGRVYAGSKISICEPCFGHTMAGELRRSHLWGALKDRLSALYKHTKEGKA